MGFMSLGLIAAGIVLIVVGVVRARDPYRRYMALREQDANVARYEAWRGGIAPRRTAPAHRWRCRCSAARRRSEPGS